jgi:hypothetical protein
MHAPTVALSEIISFLCKVKLLWVISMSVRHVCILVYYSNVFNIVFSMSKETFDKLPR